MIQAIRVIQIKENEDLKGLDILSLVKKFGIKKVRTAKVYRVEGINRRKAKFLAEKLLSESINQKYSIDKSIFNGKSKKIEIAYKPGVMNPEVASITKAAKDLSIKLIAADSSTEYYFFGNLKRNNTKALAEKLKLFNPIVETIVDSEPKTLKISGVVGSTSQIPIRKMTDDELLLLSKDKLFLSLEEMKVIQNYFKKIQREPTDLELETLAQTWSEHCAHKTFKANLIVDGKKKKPLIERLKKEAFKHNKNIVSAFVDNSGVMDFYDGFAICGKVETHNSPSAIEPYGGAATGTGGVFRDTLGTGQGAKTIASTDMFCFANLDLPKKDLPQGCLPPSYLLKRVVAGVRDYGNRMGIPTNNGSVHFHNDFRAKPTIIVGAYGIIKTKKAQKGQVKVGDIVVAVGGKTGRDGIHGATFSSGEMTDKTININSSAVQIGNAIEEKRMSDAILEASNLNLIQAIQDCGAGGFSSAIGEMGEKTGVTIDLSKAPLKYQGLSPWEIWVSESQERMIIGISKAKLKKFMKICKKYNVEATILGKFDGTKKLNLFYREKAVSNLSMEFLHHGLPKRNMKAVKPKFKKINKTKKLSFKTKKDWISNFEKVLSHGNVCSKEPIVRLYDHTVQGTNILQPFMGEQLDGPTDAVVIKPILGKNYGMIISHGLNPVLNNIDPYLGSIWASVEALSNYVSVGGDYRQASLINNYIWPFPDEESLWSLDKSVDAVTDIMNEFKIPVISGKDSLSSTYRNSNQVIKIPPVLCMSVFGRIPNVEKTVSSDFKQINSVICLLGKQDLKNMGGSVFYDVNRLTGNDVPKNNLKSLPYLFNKVYKEIQENNILSCHDISEGGLITSIFEMCVGGNLGAEILAPVNQPVENFLFNETVGCFVVEIKDEKLARKSFKNIPFRIIGKTIKENKISVWQNNKLIFEDSLKRLKKSWQKPMQEIFT